MDELGSMGNTLAGCFADSHSLIDCFLLSPHTPTPQERMTQVLCHFSRNPRFRIFSWNLIRYFGSSRKVKNSYDPKPASFFFSSFESKTQGTFPKMNYAEDVIR